MKFPNMDSYLFAGRNSLATKALNRMSIDECRMMNLGILSFLINYDTSCLGFLTLNVEPCVWGLSPKGLTPSRSN